MQGYGKVASYAEGKLFLVEELLLVIKLVLGGPGSFQSPPRGPQGDGLMRGAAWLSWRAHSFGVAAEQRLPHTVLSLGVVCPEVP